MQAWQHTGSCSMRRYTHSQLCLCKGLCILQKSSLRNGILFTPLRAGRGHRMVKMNNREAAMRLTITRERRWQWLQCSNKKRCQKTLFWLLVLLWQRFPISRMRWALKLVTGEQEEESPVSQKAEKFSAALKTFLLAFPTVCTCFRSSAEKMQRVDGGIEWQHTEWGDTERERMKFYPQLKSNLLQQKTKGWLETLSH